MKLPTPRPLRVGSAGGISGAFVAGLLLSLVLGPCGTPILAAVLSYAATQHNLAYGGVLVFVYGVGAGLPVLVFGAATAELVSRMTEAGLRPWIDRATGALLLALGFYVLWTA